MIPFGVLLSEMGAFFSSIKNQVREEAEKGYEDVLAAMDTLQQLADAKANLFYSKLVDSEKLKEYNISKIQNLDLRTYVSISEESKLADEVKNAVGYMMDGDWLDGLVSVFKTVLDAVLGKGAGSQAEQQKFFVFASGIGISRLDFYVFTKEVAYKQIMSKNTKVVVIGYALSSIDVQKITRADLNEIVGNKAFYDKDHIRITDEMELLKVQTEYAEQLAKANGIEY